MQESSLLDREAEHALEHLELDEAVRIAVALGKADELLRELPEDALARCGSRGLRYADSSARREFISASELPGLVGTHARAASARVQELRAQQEAKVKNVPG